MADLLDIAPTTASEVVHINGQRLTVHSLGGGAIAALAVRFPDLIATLFSGLSAGQSASSLVGQFGAAIGPIIAAGCGHLGDEQYERRAETAFLLEDQLKLTVAVIGITFPNGLGFFEEMVKRVERFTSAAAGEAEKKTFKVRRSKVLPSVSPPSSEVASRPNMQ